MKRSMLRNIIIFILVLTMIPFVACKDSSGTPPEEEIKTVSLPLDKYTVIRPVFTTPEIVGVANSIVDAINTGSGTKNASVKTDKKDIAATEHEIIIGNTTRPESVAALEELATYEGEIRYLIKLSGSKIIIVGTDDASSLVGARYFLDNCFSSSVKDKSLVLPENYSLVSDALDCVNLITNGVMNYTLVRSEDNTDVFNDVVIEFRSKLVNITGVSSVKMTTDYIRNGQEHDSEALEILIGDTNYNETEQVKSEFGSMQYGTRVVGNKVVVYAPSPDRLKTALNDLINLIASVMTGEKGKDTVNVRFIGEATKTYVEFGDNVPSLDGADLDNASYAKDTNTYTLQYSDATAEHFNAYRAKLEAASFTLVQENRIGENLYATYTSDKYGVHFYYTAPRKTIHLSVYNAKDPTLPSVAESYEKICEPSVTQMGNLNVDGQPGGMGYIFRLEDSSFIVVDGGVAVANEVANLYNKLRELNVRPDGQIIVRVWFITHGHGDHYNVFRHFNYSGAVKVESVAGNYISYDFRSYCDTPDFWDYRTDANSFGCKYVNLHTGQKISYAGATVTVYYTAEDLLPTWKIRTLNDTCIAFVFEIGGQRIFIGADVEELSSDIIASMYEKADLKCDFLQVCHHGYYGGSRNLYGAVDPDIVLWPASKSLHASIKGIPVNSYLLNDLNVKEVYVAGECGDVTFTLPYTPSAN